MGARVGLLDADLHGPNAPTLLPTDDQPGMAPNGDIHPPESDEVMVMSTEYLMPEEGDEPAALLGPMVNNVRMKFINEVHWGYRDYLVVDLPPGTGDASISLLQTLPVAGVVIVTTVQEMAIADARKSLRLFERHDAPVLGVVENMSAFRCPGCEDEYRLFGSADAADALDAPLLARLPAHPDFDSERTDGAVVRDEASPLRADLVALTERVADGIGEVNRRQVAEHVETRGMYNDATPPSSANLAPAGRRRLSGHRRRASLPTQQRIGRIPGVVGRPTDGGTRLPEPNTMSRASIGSAERTGGDLVFENGALPERANTTLAELPRERRHQVFRCNSGRRLEGEWVGVPLWDLLDAAAVADATTHLLVDSSSGYTACVSVPDALDSLLAFEERRVDREATAGATPRLVGPAIDSLRAVKGVTRITGTSYRPEEDPTAYEHLPSQRLDEHWSHDRRTVPQGGAVTVSRTDVRRSEPEWHVRLDEVRERLGDRIECHGRTESVPLDAADARVVA